MQSRMGWASSHEMESQTERIRFERIANSEQITLVFVSPPPGCTESVRVLETVGMLLGRMACKLGLDHESDGALLQLEFCGAVYGHETELKDTPLRDRAECSVLGLEEAKRANTEKHRKLAARAVHLESATFHNRVAEVRLVCELDPDRVNAKHKVRRVLTGELRAVGVAAVCADSAGDSMGTPLYMKRH